MEATVDNTSTKSTNYCRKYDGEYLCGLASGQERCKYFEPGRVFHSRLRPSFYECGYNPDIMHCLSGKAHRDCDVLSRLEAI